MRQRPARISPHTTGQRGTRRLLLAVSFAATAAAASFAQTASGADPLPQTISEFQAIARRILEETGVPGAGLALVRRDGVEWAGGLGLADRDEQTPVTADTHFRVGSISKTFVAMSLVQLYEDGLIDLEAPVREIAPEIAIDNPWEDTHPVRVIHLLQHTAGFDDMHFNEMYVPAGEPEMSLENVLKRNPNSRRVRWPPGTRMSYSNPGYAVAGRLLEKVSEQPFEDYIRREIFAPLEMTTSSFRLGAADEALLAQGYAGPSGPPVGFPRIYLRPAGNMHSSAGEMARFVQMLLGWGELGPAFVVDPEFLGNMEQPRTTLAAQAGLRNGYGSGIGTFLGLPFKVLGHGGGIDGFLSSYAYSPSRDVGFVVLLNSSGGRAGEALQRLSALALNYLKRDVEPPARPVAQVAASTLDRYAGYYHDASPRNQLAWPMQWILSGLTITRDGDVLDARPLVGEAFKLVPVTENSFRLESEIDASRVFADDPEGGLAMAGDQLFAERTSRWRVEIVRVPLLAAVALIGSVFVAAVAWVARIGRAQPHGFWDLKIVLLLCPLVVLAPFGALAVTPMQAWGTRSPATIAVFVASLGIPAMALVVAVYTLLAARERASRWLVHYAAVVSLAMAGLGLYLSSHGMLGLRLWTY